MKIYLTGDLHFNHKRILNTMQTRMHFLDMNEMNNYLINSINSVVTDRDSLYILGDVGLYIYKDDLRDIIMNLNGQIRLVMGNHDMINSFRELESERLTLPNGRPKLVVYGVGAQISYKGIIYLLTHYPMDLLGAGSRFRNFCAHLHEKKAPFRYCMNVGIDSPELPADLPFGVPILFEDAAFSLHQKYIMEEHHLHPSEALKHYNERGYTDYKQEAHLWAVNDDYPVPL